MRRFIGMTVFVNQEIVVSLLFAILHFFRKKRDVRYFTVYGPMGHQSLELVYLVHPATSYVYLDHQQSQ